MQTEQRTWTLAQGWSSPASALARSAQQVLVSGSRSRLEQAERREEIWAVYPTP